MIELFVVPLRLDVGVGLFIATLYAVALILTVWSYTKLAVLDAPGAFLSVARERTARSVWKHKDVFMRMILVILFAYLAFRMDKSGFATLGSVVTSLHVGVMGLGLVPLMLAAGGAYLEVQWFIYFHDETSETLWKLTRILVVINTMIWGLWLLNLGADYSMPIKFYSDLPLVFGALLYTLVVTTTMNEVRSLYGLI